LPSVRCNPQTDHGVVLMLRVKRDDAGAFAELVDHYWARIFGRFFRWSGDRQEAEDLAQEVFLRLDRSRQRYPPRAKFTTWLFHISQNVTRNAIRSRRRHPWVQLGSLSRNGEEVCEKHFLEDKGDAPPQSMERSELAGVVRAAVSDLGGRQRLAL